MIHIWERCELAALFDLDRVESVRRALSAAQIPHRVKTIDRNAPSLFSRGSRERSGTLFQDMGQSWYYVLYVRRADLARAQACADLGPIR